MNDRAPFSVLLLGSLPPPVGGIATFTQHLLAEASDRDDVRIELVDCSVRFRRVTQLGLLRRFIGGSLRALSILRRLRLATAASQFDVAHICSAGGLGFIRDLIVLRHLRRRGIPALLWFANSKLPGQIRVGGLAGRLAVAVLRAAGNVVVLDEETRRCVAQYPWLRVKRIPVFVRPDVNVALRQVQQTNDAIDVVYVGWVIPTKGVMDLALACAVVGRLRARFIGPVEANYATRLRLAGDSASIEIPGVVSREELIASMSRAKMVVLPSYGEGSPLAVLEAMALGKPVIATRTGSIAEMLAFDSRAPCGVEIPVGDIYALAAAISSLLSDAETAARLGERGATRVRERFSPRAVFPQYLAFWRTVAGRGEETH